MAGGTKLGLGGGWIPTIMPPFWRCICAGSGAAAAIANIAVAEIAKAADPFRTMPANMDLDRCGINGSPIYAASQVPTFWSTMDVATPTSNRLRKIAADFPRSRIVHASNPRNRPVDLPPRTDERSSA